MAQMADHARAPYPTHQEYHPGYAQQQSPAQPRQDGGRDGSSYPPPPDPRQGQYPPAPHNYPPPQSWAGPPQGHPYPPPQHHYDPNQPPPQYHYPPPQPGQPQASPYQQPPPGHMPYPYYAAQYPPPQPPPAPRQRTAIACKYCRKRKIRCSGYDSSPDGRCQNCVRFNQVCLFHPVSSQAAFVPAAALYAANGQRPPQQDGQGQQGGQPPMLYGAHGQPLGPAGPNGQPQYAYPGQGPPQQGYAPNPYPGYPPPTPGYSPYEQNGQHVQAPPTASSDRSDRGSLKRGPPHDEDKENGANSPRPSTKPRHSAYDTPNYSQQGPTSPATSTMSYQNGYYGNGPQPVKGNNSPPAGLTPNSANSLNSPHTGSLDSKTPPPMPGSAGSSQNGRNSMKVHEMLTQPQGYQGQEQRSRGMDGDMLNKLDGRK